jgi:hypothetical protein
MPGTGSTGTVVPPLASSWHALRFETPPPGADVGVAVAAAVGVAVCTGVAEAAGVGVAVPVPPRIGATEFPEFPEQPATARLATADSKKTRGAYR